MATERSFNVSFPKYDAHILEYIKEQKNPSAFVRQAVEFFMTKGGSHPPAPLNYQLVPLGTPVIYQPPVQQAPNQYASEEKGSEESAESECVIDVEEESGETTCTKVDKEQAVDKKDREEEERRLKEEEKLRNSKTNVEYKKGFELNIENDNRDFKGLY